MRGRRPFKGFGLSGEFDSWTALSGNGIAMLVFGLFRFFGGFNDGVISLGWVGLRIEYMDLGLGFL